MALNRCLRLTLLFWIILHVYQMTGASLLANTAANSLTPSNPLSYLLPDKTPPDPCYDSSGKPRRCITDFVNAAFGKEVRASSSCGTPPSRYCQTSHTNDGKIIRNCFICDDSNPKRSHPASYLTDLNNPNNQTCWQSEPFTEVGDPQGRDNNVTLSLSLGKKYELTYISLQFCGIRPDSMSILKSVDYGRTWIPFQFYSSNCKGVYGRGNRVSITKANEQEALCTDAHLTSNSLDPQKGNGVNSNAGRVAFSTLEGMSR